MGTRIAQLYAEISADTTKLQSGVTQAKSKLSSMKDGLNDVARELTGFDLKTLASAGAITALAKGVKDSIDQYYAYTAAVQKMSDSTGMATEEISKIVQVADDFRVEQGTVEMALKMALQNGFNPTIENLAKLADQYNATVDPTKRAADMQKIFGRSWADIVPLLAAGGDAIRANVATINDARVVTEKAAQAAKDYYAATDALGDAWTATKFSLAEGAIPALTLLINTLVRSDEAAKNSGTSWMRYVPVLNNVYDVVTGVVGVIDAQTAANIAAASKITDNEAAVRRNAKANQEAIADITGMSDATTKSGDAASEAAVSMTAYLESINKTDAATRNLTSAMTEFSKQTLYAAAAEGLSAADALNLAKSMGLVDEKSMYATQKIAGWKEELAAGTMTLQEYNALVYSLGAGLGALESKHLTITLDYIETHSSSKDYRHGGAVDDNMAGGGQFVIPPGYPNDSYPLGPGKWGQSGETVTVTPAGRNNKTGNNITYNIFTSSNPGTIQNALTLSRLMGGAA